MADHHDEGTHSGISGGIQHGPVLQGRDFNNVQIVTNQAAAPPVALVQLPALVAGFTGRDAELAEITALLDPAANGGAVVVCAVAGMPGVGKTALAVQAAHAARQAGRFPGGVLFIDLHGYHEAPVRPDQALDALLRALGVAAEDISPTTDERATRYRSELARIDRPILIIADNASSEAQVQPLLPGPGPHRVIVTSRHTLGRLDARILDVNVLNVDAGVALLDAALRKARPADDRIAADRPGAVRLAEICGGLPLALQISAALLRSDETRTVGDLAGELSDEVRLKRLAYDDDGGTSTWPVAAAFELSYRQLGEAAARVFRLLPVNPGPDVSTAAAAALADLPMDEVRRLMRQLVRAHLVEKAAGAPGRWRMHDLLRLYARQLTDARAEADEQERARDRLLGYYLETARAADAHLRPPGTPVPAVFASRDEALAWLDTQRPSLVGAVSAGRDQVAMELPLALCQYFYSRRLLDNWLDTLAISLETARKVGNRRQEGRALSKSGWALFEANRFSEGVKACREALDIFRETRQDEGEALINLGLNLRMMHNKQEANTAYLEQAATAYRDAVAIFRKIGDQHGEGLALSNLGRVLGGLGHFPEAIADGETAVTIFREINDRPEEGGALINLGESLRQAGKLEKAITTYKGAIRASQDVHNLYVEGQVHALLGRTYLELQQVDPAITCYRKALEVHREARDRRGEEDTLVSLSEVYKDLNQPDKVRKCLDAADILRIGGYYDLTDLLKGLAA